MVYGHDALEVAVRPSPDMHQYLSLQGRGKFAGTLAAPRMPVGFVLFVLAVDCSCQSIVHLQIQSLGTQPQKAVCRDVIATRSTMPDPAPIIKTNLRVVLRNLPFAPIWQIGDTTMLQGDTRRVAGGCFRGILVDGRDDSSSAYN
ncbi:hypothetical protein CHU98_g5563 [Xylaria longipes]|nr:hypothetical protein CHU98_g5563 [Xylaria longipes]